MGTNETISIVFFSVIYEGFVIAKQDLLLSKKALDDLRVQLENKHESDTNLTVYDANGGFIIIPPDILKKSIIKITK